MNDTLVIAGRTFSSRLMVGTGKYRNFSEMVAAIESSGSEIVTVAIRRMDLDKPGEKGILDYLDLKRIQLLPNTAGAKTVDEAVRLARLARAAGLTDWIKLEVQPDGKYLLPDPVGTLQAARILAEEGFKVLPYTTDSVVLAQQLIEAGCVTVMPAASPIGTGQGVSNIRNINMIREISPVPVVVDSGLGVPSDAAFCMEYGVDAVLINTAIAQAQQPGLMAEAMRDAVIAGRKAWLAGRIPVKDYAAASSPITGLPALAAVRTESSAR